MRKIRISNYQLPTGRGGASNLGRRIKTLNYIFPGITRVIHNEEVKKGDLLISDFHIGLKYGFMNGGTEPVMIRMLEVDGELLKGAVLTSGNDKGGEIGYFKNEMWFFISHRFTIYSSGKSSNQ